VIGFMKEEFQPQTIVLGDAKTELHVTLARAHDSLGGRTCPAVSRDARLVGRSLKFAVPKRGFKVEGGKWDVDYVKYVVKPVGGKALVELWFGLNAISGDPEDEQFLNSKEFEQRYVLSPDLAEIGLDTRGQLRNGGFWRQVGIGGQGGALYLNATSKEAALFDGIIDSLCFMPSTRN
jgi:hypothetical protein